MPRILVVDDDEAIAELIGVYLRNEGFDVEMFGDGARRPYGHLTHMPRRSIWQFSM